MHLTCSPKFCILGITAVPKTNWKQCLCKNPRGGGGKEGGGGGGENCITGDVQAAYRLFSDTWTTDRGLLRWLEYFFEYSDGQFISGDQEPALGGDTIGDIWLQLSEFIPVFAFLLVNLSVSLTFNKSIAL